MRDREERVAARLVDGAVGGLDENEAQEELGWSESFGSGWLEKGDAGFGVLGNAFGAGDEKGGQEDGGAVVAGGRRVLEIGDGDPDRVRGSVEKSEASLGDEGLRRAVAALMGDLVDEEVEHELRALVGGVGGQGDGRQDGSGEEQGEKEWAHRGAPKRETGIIR